MKDLRASRSSPLHTDTLNQLHRALKAPLAELSGSKHMSMAGAATLASSHFGLSLRLVCGLVSLITPVYSKSKTGKQQPPQVGPPVWITLIRSQKPSSSSTFPTAIVKLMTSGFQDCVPVLCHQISLRSSHLSATAPPAYGGCPWAIQHLDKPVPSTPCSTGDLSSERDSAIKPSTGCPETRAQRKTAALPANTSSSFDCSMFQLDLQTCSNPRLATRLIAAGPSISTGFLTAACLGQLVPAGRSEQKQ